MADALFATEDESSVVAEERLSQDEDGLGAADSVPGGRWVTFVNKSTGVTFRLPAHPQAEREDRWLGPGAGTKEDLLSAQVLEITASITQQASCSHARQMECQVAARAPKGAHPFSRAKCRKCVGRQCARFLHSNSALTKERAVPFQVGLHCRHTSLLTAGQAGGAVCTPTFSSKIDSTCFPPR